VETVFLPEAPHFRLFLGPRKAPRWRQYVNSDEAWHPSRLEPWMTPLWEAPNSQSTPFSQWFHSFCQIHGLYSSYSQSFPIILWNYSVHCRVHNSLPIVPTLSQTKSVPLPRSHFLNSHFNIIFPPTNMSLNLNIPRGGPLRTPPPWYVIR